MRCAYGRCTGPAQESPMSFNILAMGPTRHPYGQARVLTQPEFDPYGPRTGCLWSLNLYGAHKLIMHALKNYGPVRHSGLQQSARPHIQVSVGDEKWSDLETGKVIHGHNAAVFATRLWLAENKLSDFEVNTQTKNFLHCVSAIP